MSDELKLSNQLLDDIRNAVAAHDERADDDLVLIQYLAACEGFVLGQQSIEQQHKAEVLSQLHEFSEHVMQDTHKQTQAAVAAAPPPTDATGVWKPGDK